MSMMASLTETASRTAQLVTGTASRWKWGTQSRLVKRADSVFTIENTLYVYNFVAAPVRMTALKLEDGLFVHSPFHPSKCLQELQSIGPIQYIVSPNRHHKNFVEAFAKECPFAKTFAAPTVADLVPQVNWSATLGDVAPDEWRQEIDQHHVKGIPKLEEVVFFHKKSKTLLLTDIAFNFSKNETSFPLSWYLTLADGYKSCCMTKPFIFLIKDPKATMESFNAIMEWDFDRIIFSHGEVIESGGKRKFEQGAYEFVKRIHS